MNKDNEEAGGGPVSADDLRRPGEITISSPTVAIWAGLTMDEAEFRAAGEELLREIRQAGRRNVWWRKNSAGRVASYRQGWAQ